MANTAIHAAIGMAICKVLPIWWLSLLLSFISHFIMDLYPEASVNNTNFRKKENLPFVIIQNLLFLFVVFIGILQNSKVMVLCAIIANLPDMWDAVNVLLKRKKFWFTHGGDFPLKVSYKDWQGFSMKPWQNAALDTVFVVLILLLILI